MTRRTVYPLVLNPILKEKVWGGRRLEHYGKVLAAGSQVGESWEVADMPATSPSGGGGDEARSLILNGLLAGRQLHDAVVQWGSDLLGDVRLTPNGDFPLLVKFLDAREHLSVQVHPTAAYVAAHPGAHLKDESWYVVEAEPGAHLFKGLEDGVTRDTFIAAVAGGSVVELLKAWPAVPGDVYHLPSGTVHALGAGVLVAEVQTPSDTTFRIYDWAKEYSRAGRELHVEAALASMDFGPVAGPNRLPPGEGFARLVDTDHFSIWEVRGPASLKPPAKEGCEVVMVLSGELTLDAVDESYTAVRLAAGSTAVLPAAAGPVTAFRAAADVTYLRIQFGPRQRKTTTGGEPGT
ncbi:MAG: class I mannose-6-phosphate isomerase [Acidobacteria bacterium]|nr:class I mannose-6-phosphate isomerase [Acidobacteriota bacterium]